MEKVEDPLRLLVTLTKPESTDPNIQMEYDQVNENYRMLADIRFKLLALVPPLGGVAIFALSKMAGPEDLKPNQYALALLVSVLGFLATLGITFYDQRNSELYNALGGRANHLEYHAGLDPDPTLEPSKAKPAGQFLERPRPTRRLMGVPIFLMKHDRGLALIYGSVLGAWFFPILSAGLGLAKASDRSRAWIPIGVAAVMVIGFIVELLRLDDTFSEDRWGTVTFYEWPKLLMEFTIRHKSSKFTGVLSPNCRVQMEDGSCCNLNDAHVEVGDRVRVRYKKHRLKRITDPASPEKTLKANRVFRLNLLDEKPKQASHGVVGEQSKPTS